MKSVQRWRASNTFTETQWAALMASATQRGAFSRGAFALVVADQDGAFVGLYQKGQRGSSVDAFVLIAPVASGPPLSNVAPLPLGVAAAGTSPDASRADHVHLLPPAIATAQATANAAAAAAAAAQSTANAATPQSRTVAGAPLTGDISSATLATALGLGAVTATGANAAAAQAAIGLAAPPAVVALALTAGGGSHGIFVTATVTIGGVPVAKAVVQIWVHYPNGNIVSWSVATGAQISISNPPAFPGANSTCVIEADGSGVARAFYGGNATGGTLYAQAQALSPLSAAQSSSLTIPA